MAVASARPYASLPLAPDRQPCQYPTTHVSYRLDALPTTQPIASKHCISYRNNLSIISIKLCKISFVHLILENKCCILRKVFVVADHLCYVEQR